MKRTLWVMSVLLLTSQAQAFTLVLSNGRAVLGWGDPRVNVEYNWSQCSVSADRMTAYTEEAMSLWNGVPTSNLVTHLASQVSKTATQAQTQANALQESAPLIVCSSNFASDIGISGSDANFIPAVTTYILINGGMNRLFGAVILNSESGRSANISNLNPEVLKLIIAHELGHLYGLGHSADTNALMYYDASSKEKLSLAKDDSDGISWLYPRREPGNAKFFGCGALAVVGAGVAGSGSDDSDGGPMGGSGAAAVEFSALLAFMALMTRLMKPNTGPRPLSLA